HNADPKSFIWTKSEGEIFKKVKYSTVAWPMFQSRRSSSLGDATCGAFRMDSNKIPESRVEAGMHVDLAGQHTYGEYLKLDLLLSAQQPVSLEHDEVAFIIIHHVQELWLKLVAHEIEAAIVSIRADHL